ncbi:hypothetical protein PspS35_20020 [Pseudomonas sp. S35]|uniref:hypothetical protein n=1 Tax=Pseudomonas sp. S35 TaxID=1573719 RepID=UPI00132F2E01|nr:hypothetical protein [Pseudomonas sp. S35]QHF45963.1 hypothetical protein PspS35_20020 [Pseudomonas sp. S35]
MNNDPIALYWRFYTPDPGIGPREQVPMLAQELAWAREHGGGHRFSWIAVLCPPLCFGLFLPSLAFLLSLLLYRAVFDAGLDVDRIIGDSFGWQVLAGLVFTAAWALRNYLRDRHDPINAYWQAMPGQGVVEVERHTLVSGISLWASDFDPDCNALMQWNNGRLERTQSSGVSQWVVALTTAGHWLVIKDEYPGDFTYNRVGCMPAAQKRMQPSRDVVLAFAPRTNLLLGRRFEGEPIPLTHTAYWLSAEELKRLVEAAHHWTFFPPERYGVVNPHDAPWVQRLVEKARLQ